MYTEKWMKKKIKLSERSLTQKNTYHMIPVNWGSRIGKLIYGEKKPEQWLPGDEMGTETKEEQA